MAIKSLLLALLFAGTAAAQTPMGTAFTYQGELLYQGEPADGLFDLKFVMYDSAEGCCIASTIYQFGDYPVTDGILTIRLNFGGPYPHQQYWLDIAVRPSGSEDPFTQLAPRQKITAVPFAINALHVGLDSIGAAEIDADEVQHRVDQSCSAGSSIRSISAAGDVTCETDDVGISGYQRVSAASSCPPSGVCTLSSQCGSGLKVLGGGVDAIGYGAFPPTVVRSYPNSDSIWTVELQNHEPFVGINMTVWAICGS